MYVCVSAAKQLHMLKKSLREKEEVDLHEMTRKGEKKLDVGDWEEVREREDTEKNKETVKIRWNVEINIS